MPRRHKPSSHKNYSMAHNRQYTIACPFHKYGTGTPPGYRPKRSPYSKPSNAAAQTTRQWKEPAKDHQIPDNQSYTNGTSLVDYRSPPTGSSPYQIHPAYFACPDKYGSSPTPHPLYSNHPTSRRCAPHPNTNRRCVRQTWSPYLKKRRGHHPAHTICDWDHPLSGKYGSSAY